MPVIDNVVTFLKHIEATGNRYALTTSKEHKKQRGQFFTPAAVAEFMAGLITSNFLPGTVVRIADPGCGQGILACSAVIRLVEVGVRRIHVDLFETDRALLSILTDNLRALASFCEGEGVELTWHVVEQNFITYTKQNVDRFRQQYDLVISNPPYFKLGKNGINFKALQSFAAGITNIYAGFVVVAAELLKEGGELIFITPRSFTAGLYFKSLRTYLFDKLSLEFVHLFQSRTATFKTDKVLQETVVFRAGKRPGREVVRLPANESCSRCDFRPYSGNTIRRSLL